MYQTSHSLVHFGGAKLAVIVTCYDCLATRQDVSANS